MPYGINMAYFSVWLGGSGRYVVLSLGMSHTLLRRRHEPQGSLSSARKQHPPAHRLPRLRCCYSSSSKQQRFATHYYCYHRPGLGCLPDELGSVVGLVVLVIRLVYSQQRIGGGEPLPGDHPGVLLPYASRGHRATRNRCSFWECWRFLG